MKKAVMPVPMARMLRQWSGYMDRFPDPDHQQKDQRRRTQEHDFCLPHTDIHAGFNHCPTYEKSGLTKVHWNVKQVNYWNHYCTVGSLLLLHVSPCDQSPDQTRTNAQGPQVACVGQTGKQEKMRREPEIWVDERPFVRCNRWTKGHYFFTEHLPASSLRMIVKKINK